MARLLGHDTMGWWLTYNRIHSLQPWRLEVQDQGVHRLVSKEIPPSWFTDGVFSLIWRKWIFGKHLLCATDPVKCWARSSGQNKNQKSSWVLPHGRRAGE